MIRFFIVLSLFLSVSTFSRIIEIEVPDELVVGKVTVNFDNSITIEEPKLFVEGEYLSVIADEYRKQTREGLCSLFRKSESVSYKWKYTEFHKLVSLNSDGTLHSTVKHTYKIDSIRCR